MNFLMIVKKDVYFIYLKINTIFSIMSYLSCAFLLILVNRVIEKIKYNK